ncbi:AIG2-like family [Aspergillus sclerotialis]|uniref:AIG2-like family n=1 Tax=Aspergillus sclerotialis TaxID=2070753 RepID=A0A3A2ZQ07_9EURO|nr:AIG2-like family [Aspergillus sclerotialis]
MPRFSDLFLAKEEPLSPFYTMVRSVPPDYITVRRASRLPTCLSSVLLHLRNPNRPGPGEKNPRPARGAATPRDRVTGSAYLVRSEEEAQKLSYYETNLCAYYPRANAYEVSHCWIYFKVEKDPKETGGRVFMFPGDVQALLDQQFDRKL